MNVDFNVEFPNVFLKYPQRATMNSTTPYMYWLNGLINFDLVVQQKHDNVLSSCEVLTSDDLS